MHRLHVDGALRVVAQRLAQHAHRLGERVIADEGARPHGLHQRLLRHQPPGLLEQAREQRQRARRQRHLLAAAPERLLDEVEAEGAEGERGGARGVVDERLALGHRRRSAAARRTFSSGAGNVHDLQAPRRDHAETSGRAPLGILTNGGTHHADSDSPHSRAGLADLAPRRSRRRHRQRRARRRARRQRSRRHAGAHGSDEEPARTRAGRARHRLRPLLPPAAPDRRRALDDRLRGAVHGAVEDRRPLHHLRRRALVRPRRPGERGGAGEHPRQEPRHRERGPRRGLALGAVLRRRALPAHRLHAAAASNGAATAGSSPGR